MTEWYKRYASNDFQPHKENEGEALISGLHGADVVRLPPELGGEEERITKKWSGRCVCGVNHEVDHVKLQTISVAECGKLFLWYRSKD